MKIAHRAFVIALMCSLGLANALAQIDIKDKPRVVPGEILVKMRDLGALDQQTVSTLQEVGVSNLKASRKGSFHRANLVPGKSLEQVLEACKRLPFVEYAEPNYKVYALETSKAPPVFPNDPRFGDLWGLEQGSDNDIDAPEAWDQTTGSRDVVVGIIDTGVDYDHDDLQANMWTNPGETGLDGNGNDKRTNGVDDDNNGYVDDFRGWNFVFNNNNPFDDNDHGTHVAGTVGAVGNNAIGVVGVNWEVSLMPLKFLGADGSGTTADATEAIIYAVENGAKILNNSWGGGGASQVLEDAINLAEQNGVLFIAAAGNSGQNTDNVANYPSNYNVANVISVASSDRNDEVSSFSNFGRFSVDLAAPGSSILSTRPRGRYQQLSGTSMATPHVAGACALIWARYPNLQPHQVLVRLLGSVDRKSQFLFKMTTAGRLNVARALRTEPLIAFTTDWRFTDDTVGPYPVSTQVIDDGTVTSVKLVYTLNGTTTDTVAMSSQPKDSYTAAIPGQSLETEINYLVMAQDNDGNLVQTPTFSFRITTDDDDRGGGGCCGQSAVAVNGVDDSLKLALETPLNVAFFLLPIYLIRRRKKSQ